MPRQINFITLTTTLPGGGNGWVYVRPSSAYQYNDGTTVEDVSGALTDYRVQAGKIINPGGSPPDSIIAFPNLDAANDPSDTYWIVEMDLAGSYQILYRLRLTDVLADFGKIEIGDIDPSAIVLGDAVTTVADDTALLGSAASPGDVYHVTLSANNNNQPTTYQLKAGGNPAVIGDWTIVTTLWSDLILTASELQGLTGGGLTDIQAHVSDADPHGQYLLRSDSSETSTGGPASDGLGDAVRAKAANGKIDGTFFDANDIPITAPGNGVSATNVQAALDEIASEYVRNAGDTITGQYTAQGDWTFQDPSGTDKVNIVTDPSNAFVRITNNAARFIARNADASPASGDRTGLAIEDSTGTIRWAIGWREFVDKLELIDSTNGDVVFEVPGGPHGLFTIINRNVLLDRTSDAADAILSIFADATHIGDLRLGGGGQKFFVQVNASGELSIRKIDGAKALKITPSEVLTFDGREIATWYAGSLIAATGVPSGSAFQVGRKGAVVAGSSNGANVFTTQKTAAGTYDLFLPTGFTDDDFSFSFGYADSAAPGTARLIASSDTKLVVNTYDSAFALADRAWWFQALLVK